MRLLYILLQGLLQNILTLLLPSVTSVTNTLSSLFSLKQPKQLPTEWLSRPSSVSIWQQNYELLYLIPFYKIICFVSLLKTPNQHWSELWIMLYLWDTSQAFDWFFIDNHRFIIVSLFVTHWQFTSWIFTFQYLNVTIVSKLYDLHSLIPLFFIDIC